MGTWDDKLLDNDAALDLLAELARGVDLDRDPEHLAAGVGLSLWLDPVELQVEPARVLDALARHPTWIAAMPATIRTELERIARAPADAAGDEPESSPADDPLGHAGGPRNDALLASPAHRHVVTELADRCVDILDRAIAGEPDLYVLSGPLAALAVLVKLTELGAHPDEAAVTRWRTGIAAADARTSDERAFWDRYLANVRRALDTLVAPDQRP